MTATLLPLTRFPRDQQATHRALRVTTTWRPSGLQVARHTHELTSVAFCVAGPFEETFGKQWRHVSTRSLLVRPGGEPHANRYPARGPSRTLIVELLPLALEELRAETRVLDAPGHWESPRFAVLGRRLEVECRNADSVTPLAIEAYVYGLIVSLTRHAQPGDRGEAPWLRRVRDYLHAEFLQMISLSDLAAVAGVHASHLARTFRRVHGATIGEYVRQLRLEHATTLLVEQELPLTEVALASGFHDQSHFTRVFANAFGISPGRYVTRAGLRSRRASGRPSFQRDVK